MTGSGSEGAVEALAEGPRFAKLSPGPGMAASEVSASQRSRFNAAMIQLVAERGYERVTVHDLAGVAKVSTRAFYENFRGKEDCFALTHELVVRRTAKRVVAAQAGEADWQARLRLGFRAFFRELEREPQAARLALVDAYLDGPAVRAQARKAELLFGAMLAESFGQAPDGPRVSSVVVEAIVAGVAHVARRHVLSGGRRGSPQVADELMQWVLACRERAAEPIPQPPVVSPPAERSGARSGTSDRELSLAAVVKLALSHGYAYLTVPRVRAAAGISQPRFCAEFVDVDDCLSAAREECLDEVFGDVDRMRRSLPEEERAGAVVAALCSRFAADHAMARLCFAVDCVGPRCLAEEGGRCPAAVTRVAESLYGQGAAGRPSVAVQAGAGMVWAMIGTRAFSKRQDALESVAPLLAALA